MAFFYTHVRGEGTLSSDCLVLCSCSASKDSSECTQMTQALQIRESDRTGRAVNIPGSWCQEGGGENGERLSISRTGCKRHPWGYKPRNSVHISKRKPSWQKCHHKGQWEKSFLCICYWCHYIFIEDCPEGAELRILTSNGNQLIIIQSSCAWTEVACA